MNVTEQQAAYLQRLLDARGDGAKLCRRCGCCELTWEECEMCGGEGVEGHDCGEDLCCCLYPEDNIRCGSCLGKGGFFVCIGGCDAEGKHESKGAAA